MSNSQYSFILPRRQLFALPQDVIYSMLDKPSSHKGLMKLYQTCKYFYGKRPILIVDTVKFSPDIDQNGDPVIGSKMKLLIDHKDVTTLQTPIWVTERVEFQYFNAERLPKLQCNSLKGIGLLDSKLHFDDFLRLVSGKAINEFDTNFNTTSFVYHGDGSFNQKKVTVDQLLQYLPNVESFSYILDETCSKEMLINLCEMKFNNKFKSLSFDFHDIGSTFDANLFCEFIAKNVNDDAGIFLCPLGNSAAKLKDAFKLLDPSWKEWSSKRMSTFMYFMNVNE